MRNPFARLAAALRRPRLLRFASAALDSAAKTERTADYYADALDEPASRTLDRETREECQARGQMEFLNDSLFYGACQKVAALVVGVGPALKIDGPFSPSAAALYVDATDKTQYLERCFARFADAVDLVSKLRLATLCALYHGEVFLRKTPSVATFEKFDYAFVRPGRVADPGPTLDPLVCDGIRYDRPDDAATPVGYYVLIEGVNPNADASFEYEFVPAGEMIHLFDAIVPQQRRGVPEAQAALDLIRELKLLRRLEIQAVKNAAKTSVIFHTDDPEVLRAARASSVDGDGTIAAPKPGSRSELPDGVLVAPVGYAPTFGDAKHPTTGFDAFKKLIAADVGATLGVGSGKINNDHSSYNFSSAKMDEQNDAIAVAVRQKRLARGFLDGVRGARRRRRRAFAAGGRAGERRPPLALPGTARDRSQSGRRSGRNRTPQRNDDARKNLRAARRRLRRFVPPTRPRTETNGGIARSVRTWTLDDRRAFDDGRRRAVAQQTTYFGRTRRRPTGDETEFARQRGTGAPGGARKERSQ